MDRWTARQEAELKQLQQRAGWRWIAYVLTVIGLAAIPAGRWLVRDLGVDITDEEIWQVFGIIAGLILLLAIWLDIPAERAHKQAKILAAEKAASINAGSR